MLNSKIIQNNKHDINDFLQQIIDLYNYGKFREVVFHINNYLEKYPPSHQIYNILGITYIKLNNIKLAYECYNKAINIEPEFAVSYFNLGSLFHEQNLVEKAIENYKKAISLNPNYIDAIFNLAIVLKENGEIEKAIHAYKSILQKDNRRRQ